jgi:hypothetical protein
MRTTVEIDAEIWSRMTKGVGNPTIKRAVEEERGMNGGIKIDEPARFERESETYWNTRVLLYRILGGSYKTPQFNLELWSWYLELYWPKHVRIYGKHFSAGTEKNLNFSTSDGDCSFNAHEELDPERFLGRFGLRGKVEKILN